MTGDNRRTMRMDDLLWDALGELAYSRGRGVSISDVLRDAAQRELDEARDAGVLPESVWPAEQPAALDPEAYTEGGRAPAESQKRVQR